MSGGALQRNLFSKRKVITGSTRLWRILVLIAVATIGVFAQKNNGDDRGCFKATVEKRLQTPSKQFANKEVRSILARHGRFQTVNSDLPHFTYLGQSEDELPALGLKLVTIVGQNFWIPNIAK